MAVILVVLVAVGAGLVYYFWLRETPDTADEGSSRPKKEKTVYLVSEEFRYGEDGEVISQTSYEYDEDGRMVRAQNYDNSMLTSTVDYTYEQTDEGLLRVGTYSQSRGTARTEELLDSADRPISSKYFNKDGSCYSWSGSDFDEEGRLLKWEQYDMEGNVVSGTRFTYDRNGDQVTAESYSGGQVYSSTRIERVYDEDGYARSAEVYQNDEWTDTATYSYTFFPNGKRERVEMRTQGSQEGSVAIYDEDGHLLCMEGYDEDGELFQRTEYSYDRAGNQLSAKMTDGSGQILYWMGYQYTKIKKS